MALRPGVIFLGAGEVDEVRAESVAVGATVFELDTVGRRDREDLFDAFRSTFPLDPPIQSARSWDALSDSLWEGLYQLDSDLVCIFWSDAAGFADASPVEYQTAIAVFEHVTESLGESRFTVDRPKTVAVFISDPAP
jgi:hypothetical protein